MPHRPQEEGVPEQAGPSPPPVLALLEAKTDNFFFKFLDPQAAQDVPSHRVERTRISLSRPQFSQ